MSRRAQIRMTEDELRAFLAESKTIIICSTGSDGVPHPMPMWYGIDEDGAILMSTFAKSQKVKNLQRDPRVSLLVEAGETYAELRGVVIYGRAEVSPDTERVLDVLQSVAKRSGAAPETDDQAVREGLRRTAAKRVALRILPEKVVSWDHRKLGGGY